jgi:hypothetical protein
MKKFFAFLGLMGLCSPLFAQYSPPIEFINSTYGAGYGAKIYTADEGSGNTSLRIAVRGNTATFTDAFYIRASDNATNGNVGIGTTNPTAKLTVLQNQLGTSPLNSMLLTNIGGLTGNVMQDNTWLVRNTAGGDWTSARLHNGISIDGSYLSPQIDTRTWWERDPQADIQSWGTANNTYMTINSGKVGIGTTDTKGYLFGVNGSAIANSMTVKMYPWADYVFNKDYDLKPLKEVEAYIDQNHHLPEIPTEKEVTANGLNLGEMNKLLLKKVEELTLYLLEEDKEIKVLKKQQSDTHLQQKQIDQLINQVAELSKTKNQ